MADFDEQAYRTKKTMEAMAKLKEQRRIEREALEMAKKAGPDLSQNLAKGDLDRDSLRVRRTVSDVDITPPKTVVGKTDNLTPNKDVLPQISGDQLLEKQKQAEKSSLARRFKKAADLGDKSTMNKLRDEAQGFMKKYGKIAKKASKTGLKSIPIIGGIASAIMSGDVSAAVPGLDMADSAGPSADSLEYKFESGERLTPKEYKQLADMRKKPTQEQLDSAEEKRRLRAQALAKLSKPELY